MKGAGALIRVAGYEVETLRKRLAAIVDRRTDFEMKLAMLDAEAEAETVHARTDAEAKEENRREAADLEEVARNRSARR